MQKILKISAVSMLAIVAASGANAAGYTCEELVEYTSCNDGYYLNAGDCIEGATCGAGNYLLITCPGDYEEFPEYIYSDNWCYDGYMMRSRGENEEDMTQNLCEEEYGGEYFGPGCVDWEIADMADSGKATGEEFVPANVECVACDAGTYQPSAGQYSCITCDAGTYQPESGKTSCIDAPAGNYVAETGATGYTACTTGSYQPSAGQSSCMTCPAGSECPTTTAATLCEAGEYAPAGSTACSTCPTHAYTNASGQRVTVPATSVAGAGSATACYIDSDTYFTDAAGTYHFKEKCELTANYIATDAETSAGACDNEGYVFAYDYVWDENAEEIITPMCFLVTYSECMNMAKKMEEEWPDENVITWNESTNTCECASSWESDGGLGCAY